MAKATREALCYCVYKMVFVSKETRELKGPSMMIALTLLPQGLPRDQKIFRINEGVKEHIDLLQIACLTDKFL